MASTKTTKLKKNTNKIPASLIEAVCERISRNERVRRTLPGKGRLHIDRQVPFLCVYRQPPEYDDAGTEKLVKGEASYLVAPGSAELHDSVSRLVEGVAESLAKEFGEILIVEVWTAPDGGKANDPAVPTVLPKFTIFGSSSKKMTSTIEALAKRLGKIKVLKQGVRVDIDRESQGHPPEMLPLLDAGKAKKLKCSFIGIAVPPVFRNADSEQQFPLLIGNLRRSLSLSMRQAYFEFANSLTTHSPTHFHSLGRRAVVKAVREIDKQLGAVSNQFDYLLQLTPVNTGSAWKQFQASDFEAIPEFHYRPLPVDPPILKRELYRIAIERVEDPALQSLFEEKREELALKISMLRDRDTRRFLYQSLALFGGVKDSTLKVATELLTQLQHKEPGVGGPSVNAVEFARLAQEEFDYYRNQSDGFKAKVLVSEEVSGLIVSRGRLMVNTDLSLSPTRVRALLAHEVGTHLVTYYNGRMQPFHQLYSGLAGYEELQEGLAVLSEYLVGGLSRTRMRQLAGRVVAVRCLSDGASFVETFRTLHRDYGLTNRSSYSITMRVFRGGGLTKDAVYLRGLISILEYVRKGGDLEPLLVGKMAIKHIPIIRELQHRGFLKPVKNLPRYMQDSDAIKRLKGLRESDISLIDLVCD